MSIGLLYERSETDEMGIKLTAQRMGVDLTYVPFRKISFSIDKVGFCAKTKGKNYTKIVKDLDVILNRTQSRNRRLFSAYLMEKLGKKVINPSAIEFICYSKLRTMLCFWSNSIPFPKTIYIPCDAVETTEGGKKVRNEGDIAGLLQAEIGDDQIVIKPDAGTHGKLIMLSKNRDQLVKNIQEIKPSIINPVGILAQEFIEKWFYDLRIIVFKEKGKAPFCHPIALARGGLEDFRTNTYLGNLVFDAKLPQEIRELAIKCGKALGKGSKVWVFALDAMMKNSTNRIVDDEYLESELGKAALSYEAVKEIKADKSKTRDFSKWNHKLETSFENYKATDAYKNIKSILEESIETNKHHIVFHEANSCPEFWEHTRLIAGINLATTLIKCAQSTV